MIYSRKINRYQRTTIETAGKIDLVIMAYEKAIQCMNQAIIHFQEKQFEQKARKMQVAIDIIIELQSSLDFEKGGQIARNLDALYTYVLRRIIEGDTRKDTTVLDEAIRILSDLKISWEGVRDGQKAAPEIMSVQESGNRNTAQVAA